LPQSSISREPATYTEALQDKMQDMNVRAAVVTLILAAALLCRIIGLGNMPPPHATDDEFWYSWSGLGMLHGEKPTAWSQLEGYRGRQLGYGYLENYKYYFVKPAVDHPPLFSLIAGTFVQLTGPSRMNISLLPTGQVNLWDINLAKARWLGVALFCVSFFLLLDLASLSIGFWPACMALLFYSFGWPMILHQRLLVADNFTTPLLLLNLVLLQRYQLGMCSRRTFAIGTLILIPFATLSKIVAVVQSVVVAAMLVAHRRLRDLWLPIAGALIGIAGVMLFAWSMDWQLFRAVQASQADRFSGFHYFQRMIAAIPIVGHSSFAFILPIGWVFLFAMALDRRAPSLTVAPFAYLLGMTFLADARNVWGWHYAPVYPFLCIAYAWALRRVWRGPTLATSLAVLGLLLIWLFQNMYGFFSAHSVVLRTLYIISLAAIAAGALLGRTDRGKLLMRSVLCLTVAVGLTSEVVTFYRLTPASFTELRTSKPTGPAATRPPGYLRSGAREAVTTSSR
jgi:hypothetical protein